MRAVIAIREWERSFFIGAPCGGIEMRDQRLEIRERLMAIDAGNWFVGEEAGRDAGS
jgi:hypothetical protein